VSLLDLVPIDDHPDRVPGLVVSRIAQALGVRDGPGKPLRERVVDAIAGQQRLLMLDNFEHVLNAAPVMADLLAHCSRLKILATSRAPLRLAGEHEIDLPGLGLPDRHSPSVRAVLASEAGRLFVERARAVKAQFAVTEANAVAIAEICARLDGLPLAIELAAARIRTLTPAEMLARLELEFLKGGTRASPERHRTLWDTIDWSYAVLDQSHQLLFRRVSVFAGGCTLRPPRRFAPRRRTRPSTCSMAWSRSRRTA
jgi:predicted ATPase